ncbi:MAG: hypothetical protein KKA55_06725 [Proteobacteria bacterium]|nr:hypothetical protein [Pseudomonadota bacterium]MBU1595212.1 hypothetical protein [Pseudomonadota bacterium]
MKPYLFMLVIMYAATILKAGFALALAPNPESMLKLLADMTLLGFCVYGCYGLAYGRKLFTPQAWRLVHQGTLVLGLLTIFLINRAAPDSGFLRLALTFITYLVFAIPAILYERELKGPDKAQGEDSRG